MPTPFYHLSIAQELIAHPDLPNEIRRMLQDNSGPFLLGNTAPDVQIISGQSRQATHFFSVPIKAGTQTPWNRLFAEYPDLIYPVEGNAARTTFIAGYLCHLQADWLWVANIFLPVFGPDQSWGNFSKRLYLHNVLRAYLDLEVVQSLSPGLINSLHFTHPAEWLPFIRDVHLNEWRDYLVYQLQPGRKVKTVEVFAARHGIDAQEFSTLIQSEVSMDEHVFSRFPRRNLQNYRQHLVDQNVKLLQDYFNQDINHAAHQPVRSSIYLQNIDRSAL